MSNQETIAVIGSGPSGIAAGFRLHQVGYKVRMFEAANYIGGKLKTGRRDGFVLDEGASVISTHYTSMLRIAREAGIDLIPGGDIFGFARDGEVHHLGAGNQLTEAFATKILSVSSKLKMWRLAMDVLRSRSLMNSEDLSAASDWDTESAGDYALRCLNKEILDYIVDPSVRALVGANADKLSKVDLMFAIDKFIGAKYLVLPDGMDSYPQRIAELFECELNAPVQAVVERGEGVEVTWQSPQGEKTESFSGCVVAVAAPIAARMLPELDTYRREFMSKARYTSMTNVSVALSKRPESIKAIYTQIPISSHPGLGGITGDHARAPMRVPEGKGLVGLYPTTHWSDELMDKDDDVIIDQCVAAFDKVYPNVIQDIEFCTVNRWDPMVLMAPPGYWREMVKFNQVRKVNDKRIQLAGDYFASSSVNTASTAGERAVRELIAVLGQKTAKAA